MSPIGADVSKMKLSLRRPMSFPQDTELAGVGVRVTETHGPL